MNRFQRARLNDVLALRRKRQTYQRISDLTGVPRATVRLWCTKAGIDKPKLRFPECRSTSPVIRHIYSLVFRSGMSAQEFADKIGYSQTSVLRMFRGAVKINLHMVENSLQLFGFELQWTNTYSSPKVLSTQPGSRSSSQSGTVGPSSTPSAG